MARADFLTDSRIPFVFIIASLPFLASRLRLNQTQPLSQGIIIHYKTELMDKEECFRYATH
jgi:hypothetical protein